MQEKSESERKLYIFCFKWCGRKKKLLHLQQLLYILLVAPE